MGFSICSTTGLMVLLLLWNSMVQLLFLSFPCCDAWLPSTTYNSSTNRSMISPFSKKLSPQNPYRESMLLNLLSTDKYLENDLVAVQYLVKNDNDNNDNDSTDSQQYSHRLCVVRYDGSVSPLCQHEGDVETDLFLDPRPLLTSSSSTITITMDANGNWDVNEDQIIGNTYGEGWYGQRPVPSLGGGPGYGADADEIWSIDESTLEQLQEDHIELPILDIGIAHGEKARGGAY